MICFRNCHFIALAVLLFSVASWCACSRVGTAISNFNSGVCSSDAVQCSGLLSSRPSDCTSYSVSACTFDTPDNCPSGKYKASGAWFNGKSPYGVIGCAGNGAGSYYYRGCYYNYCCDTQAEADSIICVNNPLDPSCVVDTSACDLARARCAKLGGVFTSSIIDGECSSSCNTCGTNASKNILKVKSESCCSQGLAPEIEQMCNTPIQSGVGETYSTNANLTCADPSLSEEAASAYSEYCSGEYDWNEESSSSGGGTSGAESSSSSGEGSSEGASAGSAGLESDYYPILDTIRDTLIDIKRNVANIYTCLITPSACAGLSSGQKSGDTVIVNVPSDSIKLNDISGKLSVLDTSIHNSNDRLLEGISRGNDSLIDSMRKYLQNLESVGFSGDTLGDSLGRIHGTLEEIKGLLNGEEVDTSGYASSWGSYIEEGERIGDSIGIASGWLGGLDTVDVDSVFAAANAVASDSVKYDSLSNEVDSALQHRLDSLYNRMKLSVDSSRTSLIDSMGVWAETLKVYAPFADFDSLIYNAIGAKIPNSDECPDNCQKWSLNLPRFGLINYTVDFGLCLGRSPLGGTSVLGFIRLLVRLVVVWTCIWFVIWNFTKRKGS